MIHALISGTLFRAPDERIAKSGKSFVTATVKIRDGEGSQFIRATAFSNSAQSELLRLSDGDALAVQGRLTTEIYAAADGSNKISLSVIAEHVLALRQPPKKREAKAPAPPDTRAKQERQRSFWTGPDDDGPCDLIPF
jgi:single-stranded DNA-binding protein